MYWADVVVSPELTVAAASFGVSSSCINTSHVRRRSWLPRGRLYAIPTTSTTKIEHCLTIVDTPTKH